MVINNDVTFINRRKNLRNNSTPQEIILWSRLKNSGLGFKFRRQHSLGFYIVDFYCPAKKLVIEIDGSQHFEDKAEKYDIKRTEYFESIRIKVLRFTNTEINTNVAGVLMKIQEILESPPRFLTTKNTPPLKGGENAPNDSKRKFC